MGSPAAHGRLANWTLRPRRNSGERRAGRGFGLAISALGLMAACAPTKSATAPTPTVTTSPPPTSSGGINDALLGKYPDGPSGTPRYVVDVQTSARTHFTGWLYFEYQDGRIAPLFHYTATTDLSGDALSLKTDSSSVPFSLGTPGPLALATGGQAGSSPIPPGQTYTGTMDGTSISITDCGSFLYWATPHPGTGPAQSCTFTDGPGP
jgi:hypothetical protein